MRRTPVAAALSASVSVYPGNVPSQLAGHGSPVAPTQPDPGTKSSTAATRSKVSRGSMPLEIAGMRTRSKASNTVSATGVVAGSVAVSESTTESKKVPAVPHEMRAVA